MSYINKTVTNNGTEAEFIEELITSFVSRDSRIVRDQTAAEIASMFNESPDKISFSFTISQIFKITFTKAYYGYPRYHVTIQYGTRSFGFDFTYSNDNKSTSVDYQAERTLKYQIISNEKLMFIRFGSYNDTLPLTTTNQCLLYSDSASSFLATAVNGTYYVGSSGTQCTKATRLPYLKNSSDFTQIEVIKSVALINSSNELVANPTGMWDSSTNNAVGFPLTIGSDQCYYLDTNTVMKC